MAVWLSGNVVGCINEVTLRAAGLVLGWVTVHGYTISVSNQPCTQVDSDSYPQRDEKMSSSLPGKGRYDAFRLLFVLHYFAVYVLSRGWSMIRGCQY